ncbi:CNDP dipeptidase [Marasmius fiardii PR-910]|nr:CNDP dipeptidase [Marasmius fiardii PR-910]
MTTPVTPAGFYEYFDDENNANRFIDRLRDAVAIQSTETDPDKRERVNDMSKWIHDRFAEVGVTVEQFPLGHQEGTEVDYPPAVLGKLDVDPNKKTVLVYGHFDVQPATAAGWPNGKPFELDVEGPQPDGRTFMYGRGSTDDKGPVLGWLNLLTYFYEHPNEKLPVNLRFCFEGMEESGDDGALDRLIGEQVKPGGYFEGVDCVCISDNYWLNTRTPIVTYGIRGVAYFKLTVHGPKQNLHSGIYGRMVYEPMTDLVHLMTSLVNVDASIAVQGIDDKIARPTAQEEELYNNIDYSIEYLEDTIGSKTAVSDDKNVVLMNRMRECSLSLHGIRPTLTKDDTEPVVPPPEIGTIIPASVTGEFSVRIVPPLTADDVVKAVEAHVASKFAQLGTKNQYELVTGSTGDPWLVDYDHYNFEAAIAATKLVWDIEPNLTREGGSIPIVLTFQEKIRVQENGQEVGANVVLLPMGRGDDGAHSNPEKLDRSNYLNGSKSFGTYLYLLGNLPKNQ